MKCVAIILARGGSKGIKNKNLINVNNKPLIGWTIENALKCKELSGIFVSSDSKKILECAKSFGCETIKRPSEISSDTSTSETGWLHALNHLKKIKYFTRTNFSTSSDFSNPKKDDFSKAINFY